MWNMYLLECPEHSSLHLQHDIIPTSCFNLPLPTRTSQPSFYILQYFIALMFLNLNSSSSSSSSSSIGTTARCGLWPVEQYLYIFPYISPTLSIFSLPALEDLFLLLLSILSWVFLFVSSLPVLE